MPNKNPDRSKEKGYNIIVDCIHEVLDEKYYVKIESSDGCAEQGLEQKSQGNNEEE